ncbi:MAG TPA: YbaB/EbfC family nucleoid-associated protein [Candidatus Polarisedimenticolia bacterium]|nr:YbaB/EbfC family nucleoid-associated protein [Candidatus Polarisedimenticolia bacterium]
MDMRALMKQAQKMQEKLQREMTDLKVEGSAGGGVVTVTMSGERRVLAVHIAPETLQAQDAEMLEDLVLAAFNDAGRKVEEALGEKMGGLRLPGF